MKANDAISKILSDRDKSKRSLADDLGISPQALDIRLKARSMKVETLVDTVTPLGYRVELVSDNDKIELDG